MASSSGSPRTPNRRMLRLSAGLTRRRPDPGVPPRKRSGKRTVLAMAHTPAAMPTSTSTVVITDSACDLPQDWLDQHHVVMVPLNINFEDGSFTDRRDIAKAALYAHLAEAAPPPHTGPPAPRGL